MKIHAQFHSLLRLRELSGHNILLSHKILFLNLRRYFTKISASSSETRFLRVTKIAIQFFTCFWIIWYLMMKHQSLHLSHTECARSIRDEWSRGKTLMCASSKRHYRSKHEFLCQSDNLKLRIWEFCWLPTQIWNFLNSKWPI